MEYFWSAFGLLSSTFPLLWISTSGVQGVPKKLSCLTNHKKKMFSFVV